MKYECTNIIYKEIKHMNVSYNVKNNYEKVFFSMKLVTSKAHFFGF